MPTVFDLLAMPEPEREEAIRKAMSFAEKEKFETFEAYELFDAEDYIKMEPKETYPVDLVIGRVENLDNPIKKSFEGLAEKYGHYFEGVDPIEYVREMRGEQTNGYVFTGEWCDQ